jgi:hypothetical protein
MFLYRDVMYNATTEDKHLAEVIAAKHRNGPSEVCRLVFMPKYSAFADMPGRSHRASRSAGWSRGNSTPSDSTIVTADFRIGCLLRW